MSSSLRTRPTVALKAYHPYSAITVEAESAVDGRRVYVDATVTEYIDEEDSTVEIYATAPISARIEEGNPGEEFTLHLRMAPESLRLVAAALADAVKRADAAERGITPRERQAKRRPAR